MTSNYSILIPYGFSEWDDKKISIGNSGRQISEIVCNSSHVLIDRNLNIPLRLNNHEYNLRGQISTDDITDSGSQIAYLREHLKLFCGVWEKSQKRFLDCYFDFIDHCIEKNKENLLKKSTKFGDLYNYRHWIFSAFLPLPQPHINISPNCDAASYIQNNMQLVDFCFWTGEQIVAIILVDEYISNKQKQSNQALRNAGVVVIELEKKHLRDPDVNFLIEFLPNSFQRFWETETVPSGAIKLSTFPSPQWIEKQ